MKLPLAIAKIGSSLYLFGLCLSCAVAAIHKIQLQCTLDEDTSRPATNVMSNPANPLLVLCGLSAFGGAMTCLVSGLTDLNNLPRSEAEQVQPEPTQTVAPPAEAIAPPPPELGFDPAIHKNVVAFGRIPYRPAEPAVLSPEEFAAQLHEVDLWAEDSTPNP